MHRLLALSALLVLVGCDGGMSTPLGEPVLEVVSGDGQTTSAPRDSLNDPVVARLGRLPGGGITFRLVTPLYAQTNVVGIAGEQVCAVGIGDAPLSAWNPCAITDSNGIARFFFDPGTVATDSSCAEIRAIVDGQKTVTDTVCAAVEPGPIAEMRAEGSHTHTVAVDDTLDLRSYVVGVWDEFGNAIPLDSLQSMPDSIAASAWFDRTSSAPRPETPTQTGWKVVVPDTAGFIPFQGGYGPGLRLWINGAGGDGDADVRFKVNQ